MMDDAERFMHRRSEEQRARHRAEESARNRALEEGGPAPSLGDPPPFRPSRLRRYRALFGRKARVLLDQGATVILTNGGPLHARVHTFRDGTGVFEYEYSSPHGRASGMARLDGRNLDPDVIARYLEYALLNARVRPLADQAI